MKIIHNTLPDLPDRYPFHQPIEQITFFDIETTGLSPKTSSIYLIGAMHYDISSNHWQLTQWFADDYQSEAKILNAFLTYLEAFTFLYHFNGCSFDLPFVLEKCKKHDIIPSKKISSVFSNMISGHQNDNCPGNIDLLKEIRPFKKKLGLRKANQSFLEQWTGLKRQDIYNGGQLIKVYSEYMQQNILKKAKAKQLEKLLLLHNHDDIAGMLHVCSMLVYKDLFAPSKPLSASCSELTKNKIAITIPLRFPHKSTLKHTFNNTASSSLSLPDATLHLDKDHAVLTLPLYSGTLKYFFPDYKDYYYLPQEDTAIHKSVAQFVDASFRKKATAASCYTKKEGIFLPSLSPKEPVMKQPSFYYTYRSNPAFYELPWGDTEKLHFLITDYCTQELGCF